MSISFATMLSATAYFSRPFGTREGIAWSNPRLKPWAILVHPSGMMLAAVTALALLNGTSVFAQSSEVIESKNFRIPDLGISFNLPKDWTDLGKERIDMMNKIAWEKTSAQKGGYVAGLERNLSYTRRRGYPTYILIQKAPRRSAVKNLLTAFPKLQTTGGPGTNKTMQVRTSAPTEGYLDEKLRAIVSPFNGVGEDGSPYIGRTYAIPLRTNLLSLHVYCRTAAATNIIPEVESAVMSLKTDDSIKMQDSWVQEFKTLLQKRDAGSSANRSTTSSPAANRSGAASKPGSILIITQPPVTNVAAPNVPSTNSASSIAP